MTPPLPRDQVVMGRMALNALGGVSAGAIFLMLLAELIRQQQWNERGRGRGGEPYSWWRRHDEYGMSLY